MATDPAPHSAEPGAGQESPQRIRPFVWVGWFLGGVAVLVAFAMIAMSLSGRSGTAASSSSGFAAGITPASSALLELVASEGKRAPAYSLTDQSGTTIAPSIFLGRPVVLTFNDDKCTDLCTLFAEDVLRADQDLGSHRNDIAFVSINANPFFNASSDVASWTRAHGLAALPNWYFGTAPAATLGAVAKAYGVDIEADSATKEVVHGTQMFFIDPKGATRAIGQFGSDSADTAAFAHAMAQMAVDLMPSTSRPSVAGPALALPATGSSNVGDTPKAFSLPALAGATSVTDKPDENRFTVLNFWSSTCTACRSEMPDIEKEFRILGSRVSFLGVSVDTDAARASAFAAAANSSYPLALDSPGAVSGGFAITGLPYTVILDPTGRVVIRHPGALTAEQLDYIVRDLDPTIGHSN